MTMILSDIYSHQYELESIKLDIKIWNVTP